ncbi:MAG: hypothetical protein OXU98_10515 [Gammaproteobacteria bacterium]|nr:hypothetical protein [Gammaproteobacteria bacterium]
MKSITEQIKKGITAHHGKLERVGAGRSLFSIPATNTFIYFRYSKILGQSRPYAFFGLRKQDVDLARGGNLYLCFVTDMPNEVFLIPFADFESCYDYTHVGSDGQYKTMIFFKEDGAELYIPQSARFNAEAYRGLDGLFAGPDAARAPEIDHAGAQTLLGVIGSLKGHSIWFPKNDLDKIDFGMVDRSNLCRSLPSFGSTADAILKEIDVIWLSGSRLAAIFEVEHSTPIYSGLLRISDILISSANAVDAKIVAEQERRDAFQRQVRRPTFQKHKLDEKVSFISYQNVWQWSQILRGKTA